MAVRPGLYVRTLPGPYISAGHWLHDIVSSNDLLFPSFHPPERKDGVNNRYGGVILYVKNNISYTRRHDLEIGILECIWIQIKLVNNRNILF